jgi:ribosomal protein L11 methyltransferase
VADPRWLEVSLTVNGEVAEAVADLLARYVEGGVVVESEVKYNDAEDEGTPVGPVKVYGYLPVNEQIEENRRQLEESLWHLGQIQDLPELSYKPIEDQDWMSSWKEHYHPIPIGKKMMILPAWIEMPDPSRIAVKIDPSMAFGTGTHPTTQLCMEFVEQETRPGMNVIDVGCGSGILSIAAVKMGAKHALAVDIDPLSVKATLENGERNDVLASIETGQGSVVEVRSGQFSIKAAPLVLANILAPVIIRLFDAGLADLVETGGTLVLSGILDHQAEDVIAKAKEKGYSLVEKKQMLDWVAMSFREM